jgi:hypothetical protein
MYRTLFGVAGVLAGIPLSYYFQSSIDDFLLYLAQFHRLLFHPVLWYRIWGSLFIFGLLGFLVGYFVDLNLEL